MILFSVIMPAYNRAHLIAEAIESVLVQSYTNWELLIIDDGSKDNTKEVVLVYNDERIKYIYQDNAERCAARNNGVVQSTGEYICFLDSDDKLDKDYLMGLSKFLADNSNPVAMCISDMVLRENGISKSVTTEKITGSIYDWIFTNPVVPGRVCCHQSIMKQNDLQFDIDITIGEDVILWLRIVDRYPVMTTGVQSVIYFLHDGNSVDKANPVAIKMRKGILTAYKRYKQVFSKITASVFAGWMSRIETNIALYYMRKGLKLKALYWDLKAISTAPKHEHSRFRVNLALQILGVRKGIV